MLEYSLIALDIFGTIALGSCCAILLIACWVLVLEPIAEWCTRPIRNAWAWLCAMSDDPAGQVERDERRALRKKRRSRRCKYFHIDQAATSVALRYQHPLPWRGFWRELWARLRPSRRYHYRLSELMEGCVGWDNQNPPRK